MQVAATTLAVVDTETTGFGEKDEMCELAVVTVEHKYTKRRGAETRETERWSSLVRPTCSMHYEARATHHISDEQLEESWTTERLLKQRGLPEFEGADVLVAHFLEFDERILRQSRVPDELLPQRKICTARCGQHLYPESSKHTNQVLRYYIGIDVPTMGSLPPHRALPDAVVTSRILMCMLATHSVEELEKLTVEPVLLRTCYMGEHAGKPWSQVDRGFLRWILSKGERRKNPRGGRDVGFEPDVIYTAKFYLGMRV